MAVLSSLVTGCSVANQTSDQFVFQARKIFQCWLTWLLILKKIEVKEVEPDADAMGCRKISIFYKYWFLFLITKKKYEY